MVTAPLDGGPAPWVREMKFPNPSIAVGPHRAAAVGRTRRRAVDGGARISSAKAGTPRCLWRCSPLNRAGPPPRCCIQPERRSLRRAFSRLLTVPNLRDCSTDDRTLIAGAGPGALSAGTWGGCRARGEQRVYKLPAGGSASLNSGLSHLMHP